MVLVVYVAFPPILGVRGAPALLVHHRALSLVRTHASNLSLAIGLTIFFPDDYSWQRDVPPRVKEKVLEERRKELLDLMPAIPDPSK
jgi:hypothetical protein